MFVDEGTQLTDKLMKNLDGRLQGIYDAAYKTAIEREKTAINKLAKFIGEEHPELTPEQITAKRLSYEVILNRETKFVNNIAAEIANSGKTAAGIIQNEMMNVYGLNLDWARYDVDKQEGLLFDWTIYDKNQLKVLLNSEQPPFTKIAYKKLGQDRIIVQRLQNELTQATILGESQQQIIRRIRNVTEQSYKQAKRVAQTERVRVQSQGRQMGFDEAESMGIAMEKQWISRMDSKVRDDHASVTGEVVDNKDNFSNGLLYPGDPNGAAEQVINCRCVLKPRVKNVPDSLKRYREKMAKDYKFDEWRVKRAA